MKKVKELGLSSSYMKKGCNPVRDFIHHLMCVAYLPASKIAEVFDVHKLQAPPETVHLVSYFEQNWVKSTI